MADIAQHDLTKTLFSLLKETFEGPGGSVYLDNGAGLFQTLDALTAEAASHVPCPGAQTIAAHCAHLAYYVRVNHNYAMGREQQVDWPSSWRIQQVGDREWEELKGTVRREYAALIKTLQNLETWGEQEVGDSMAIVAHTAYHLGAIRHALRNLGPSAGK
jgi:DinB superfamily